MTLIVNLSTIHAYSINETVGAFTQICKQYSNGCLKSMPEILQSGYNYAWVMAKYKANYNTLIQPYKLGKISTEAFLDNLSQMFYFLNDLGRDERHALLTEAWNASIRITDDTRDRLAILAERAQEEPVYLISNTNALNIHAILRVLAEQNPELNLNLSVNVDVDDDAKPIEIIPNIFLCLSYRRNAFKTEAASTAPMLTQLAKEVSGPISLVSQYEGDREKATELGFDNIFDADQFFSGQLLDAETKMNLQ